MIPISVFGLDLHSPKYVIYDKTDNKLLLEKEKDTETAIASLTKIMSALVIIEEEKNLEKEVVVTNQMLREVPWDAYVIHLVPNTTYTYKDLLYGTILPSAADCITALAIDNAGSVSSFVEKMNQKAQIIGLKNTHFTNPIGMDHKENKATLQDTLKLLLYALDNPTFKEIYMTKEYQMTTGKIVYSSLKMYSEKLGLDTSRILGAKTGATGEAGLALSQIFQSNNHEIISITVGAENTKDSFHIRDGLSIIQYMDTHYSEKVLLGKNKIQKQIPVEKSTIHSVTISNQKEIKKYLPNDFHSEDFKIQYDLPEKIDYKSPKKIGRIKYYYQEELIDSEIVEIQEKIEPTIVERIKTSIWTPILLSMILFGMIVFIIKKTIKNNRIKIEKHMI